MSGQKKYRLPKSLNLGRGYVIKILIVPRAQMLELTDTEPEEGEFDGLWDDETRTIYIASELKPGSRWAVYWHELIHAVNDIMGLDRPKPVRP